MQAIADETAICNRFPFLGQFFCEERGETGRFAWNTTAISRYIALVPSVPRSLVYVKAGERYADGAEEFVDTQEIAVQSSKDDLRGVALHRN